MLTSILSSVVVSVLVSSIDVSASTGSSSSSSDASSTADGGVITRRRVLVVRLGGLGCGRRAMSEVVSLVARDLGDAGVEAETKRMIEGKGKLMKHVKGMEKGLKELGRTRAGASRHRGDERILRAWP